MGLRAQQDAYGLLIYDYHLGRRGAEVVERDDGWIGTSAGPGFYFAPFAQWPAMERRAMRWVRGRVLDVGCGAGRVALHLQSRGHAVVAIDLSPLAVRTARLRGVLDARDLSITQLTSRLGVFDSVVMYGNNFGLFGSERRARWLLARMARITSPAAHIIAATMDPYDTTTPEHRRYHRFNRSRGRMGGELRIRVRYRDRMTPWFGYLLVSRPELTRLLAPTAWRIERLIDSKGASYVAVLGKR
jgi:SAM-dependent methyltransferase